MSEIISQVIPRSIFRAYDIRGEVDVTFTAEYVYQIGLAIGSEARARGDDKVIMARDGRLSGPELSLALGQGLLSSGCDVIDIGAVPTPVLYYATHVLETRSGVMLTGSHNPANYNGVKIVLAGQTLSEDAIQALYQRIIDENFSKGHSKPSFQEITANYIAKIRDTVKLNKSLKIVVDCGNGIAGEIAPLLLRELGCEVLELFCDVDGTFPHHHPDPSQPDNLQDLIQAVALHKADLGVAFDGDGDRLGVVTNHGEIILPDRLMMLFAMDVLKQHSGAPIIFDVKCTRHLADVIAAHGGKPLLWKTGHSFIKAKMKEVNAPLAGEMSGHLFFKDRWFGFDDGLYAAARLLEIVSNHDASVSEIFMKFPDSVNTPELKLPMADEEKFSFMQRFAEQAQFANAKITTIDGVRADFPQGFGLMRASNTTPYLILRFEADDLQGLHHIQQLFRQQLLQMQPDLNLPF
jgi:phosphomannomutase/phosphoglucomutase